MSPAAIDNRDRLLEIRDLLLTVSGLTEPQEVQREFGRTLASVNRVDGYVAFSRRNLPDGHYKITRSMLARDEVGHTHVNPWTQWDDLPTHAGGWFGEMMRTPEPRLFPDFHLRDDPALDDRLAPFGSAMLVPLFDKGEALNWSLMLRLENDAFSEDDLETFLVRGNVIGRMTRNLVIQKEIEKLNERLQNQLDEIAALQRAMLPQRLPKVPGLDVAASYLTSNEAGGDYYDFFPHNDGRWSFTVADVSGHGAGAATMVARMHAILHADPDLDEGPAAVLRRLNRRIAVGDQDPNFITALFATWDPADRSITVANAGHHQPSRKPRRGEIDQLEMAADIPLGILDDVAYEQSTERLDPGDTLVLYTDGVTEAFSPPPDREMFGVDRLHAALDHCSGEPPCVIESIHERLYQHTRSRERDDDQTLLALKTAAG
jgi:sigma-B regulation protein RsbU (phosphoserine phosphatase)